MLLNKFDIARKLDKDPQEIKVGFTCSTFDLFHAGHIVMLQEAKSLCDYLIIGLLVDPTVDRPDAKNMPIQSVFERYVQVSSCQFVDEVVPFTTEQELIDMILTIQPDVRIVGEEYKGTEHTGVGLCPIHYNKRRHSFSTTDLLQRVEKSNKESINV